MVLLQIRNNSDIINKIIPFFNQYPVLGNKNLDFADFSKIAKLIENKEHLTESGLAEITKTIKGMNLDRGIIKPTDED